MNTAADHGKVKTAKANIVIDCLRIIGHEAKRVNTTQLENLL